MNASLILLFVLLYGLLSAVMAWIVEALWNIIIVGVFHTARIDYWAAVGIYVVLVFVSSFFRPAARRR